MIYGVSQYQRSVPSALSPRETEASAFVFVNRLLEQAADRLSRTRSLAKNQELWSILLKDISSSSNALPTVLKQDLTQVGLLAVRTSISSMGNDHSLAPLIQLNQDMIDALRSDPQTGSSSSGAEPAGTESVA